MRQAAAHCRHQGLKQVSVLSIFCRDLATGVHPHIAGHEGDQEGLRRPWLSLVGPYRFFMFPGHPGFLPEHAQPPALEQNIAFETMCVFVWGVAQDRQ